MLLDFSVPKRKPGGGFIICEKKRSKARNISNRKVRTEFVRTSGMTTGVKVDNLRQAIFLFKWRVSSQPHKIVVRRWFADWALTDF